MISSLMSRLKDGTTEGVAGQSRKLRLHLLFISWISLGFGYARYATSVGLTSSPFSGIGVLMCSISAYESVCRLVCLRTHYTHTHPTHIVIWILA